MFERYTERARRVLFFARYEASQLGSVSIETEHLLLGLIREGKGLTTRLFARSGFSLEKVRDDVYSRSAPRTKLSTAVEIPFTAEMKRVLGYAAQEADRLLHNYIGTEHLLLGILREERSVAASILNENGMRLDKARDDVVQLLGENTTMTHDFAVHMSAQTEEVIHTFHGSAPRRFPVFVPNFVPAETVHVAYSNYSPDQEGWIHAAGQAWRAFGFTLAQIVAYAWGSEVSRVNIAAALERDRDTRYDFMIALPNRASADIIPRLLREAIERDLGVEVTREGADPPTLIVRPR